MTNKCRQYVTVCCATLLPVTGNDCHSSRWRTQNSACPLACCTDMQENKAKTTLNETRLDVQALLPLFPELLLQLPSRVFSATSLLMLAYLGPTMWYLWMDLGTGNANFFYAITLLWAAWQVGDSQLVHVLTLVSLVL